MIAGEGPFRKEDEEMVRAMWGWVGGGPRPGTELNIEMPT